jgi:hypothetical protein
VVHEDIEIVISDTPWLSMISGNAGFSLLVHLILS